MNIYSCIYIVNILNSCLINATAKISWLQPEIHAGGPEKLILLQTCFHLHYHHHDHFFWSNVCKFCWHILLWRRVQKVFRVRLSYSPLMAIPTVAVVAKLCESCRFSLSDPMLGQEKSYKFGLLKLYNLQFWQEVHNKKKITMQQPYFTKRQD